MLKLSNDLTEHQWRELCAEWEKSKLSQKKFCAEHAVRYGAFVTWRSKILAERGATKVRKFSKVVKIPPPTTPNDNLVLKSPSGLTLFIPPSTQRQSLQMTLELLGINPC